MTRHLMRKLSLWAAVLVLAFTAAAANAVPRQEAVARGLVNDDPYAYHLFESSREPGADARGLLEEAIENAPNTPGFYFALSRAALPSLVDSFSYFVTGVKAYGMSFWWQLSLLTFMAVALVVSASISLLVVALMRFFRDLPLLSHDINEKKALMLVPLLLMGYMVLGPLCIAGGLLFMICLYKKRSHKALVYLALLIVILSPLWSRTLETALSFSNAKARAVVAVNEGRDNTLAIQVLADEDVFSSRFTYALAVMREGGAEGSIALYDALIKDSSDPRLYNNLGNAYVAIGRRDLAKTAYLKAVQSGGSVTTLFNLAQIYRDELDYDKGNKYFDQAQAKDKARVSEFAARMGTTGKLHVADDVLTPKEVISVVMDSPVVNAVMPFNFGSEIPAGYALFLFLLFFLFSGKLGGHAFNCKDCGDVSCPECSRDNKLCEDCHAKLAGDDSASPQARVKRMIKANKKKDKQIAVVMVLSFAPPGIAQAFTGRVFSAFLYMWIFSFSIVLIAMDPFMRTGLSGGSHGWVWIVAVPLILVTYYVSNLTVRRRLDRGWL